MTSPRFFDLAIRELLDSGQLVGKSESIRKYIDRCGVPDPGRPTPELISRDTIKMLARELRDAECMVFRLGKLKGENRRQLLKGK